jgi:hypothetical protein
MHPIVIYKHYVNLTSRKLVIIIFTLTSNDVQSITRIDIDYNVLFIIELSHYSFRKI